MQLTLHTYLIRDRRYFLINDLHIDCFAVNTQLMWNEDQSRTLLQLYPQVLVSHVASGDHQPMEELWLQLAKAYMNAANDRKQCYEVIYLSEDFIYSNHCL